MRIVFYPEECTPFHGQTLSLKPIGGTETAIIHLAEALDALGHDVIVISHFPDPPLTKPLYLPKEKLDKIENIDVFIPVRAWLAAFNPIKSKKRFLWTGDSYSNQNTIGLGDKRLVNQIDALLCVSHWQADSLCSVSGFPREKAWVLGDGVYLKDFDGSVCRERKRLIYTSNPQRGLIFLLYIFVKIKLKHPEAELHIFSNSAMFDMEWPPLIARDLPHEAILNMFKPIPGCFVHGTILQKQLAQEYMKSAIWVYPCKVEETFCISAMEAQAAGCAIVTSALGALEETVGGAGLLIREQPGSDAFLDKFVEAIDHLLTDDEDYRKLSLAGYNRSRNFDWKIIAANFLEYLRKQHGMV